MEKSQQRPTAIFRLTALWALCESGLGGWMHALHLPFTGFFVGGFAVIIISLIAWFSLFDLRKLLQATFMVLLVKAVVSPQSPPPAYIAVAFQGVMGAVLFRIITNFRAACILLGVIAMVESALQKVIIATLIFGASLWEAVDKFFKGILTELHLPKDISFSFWIIIIYTLIYAIWGLLLGVWAGRLPHLILRRSERIMQQIRDLPEGAVIVTEKKGGGRYKKLAGYLLLLAFIVGVLAWSNAGILPSKAAYIVVRTFAVLSFFVFVLNPLVKWILRTQAHRLNDKGGDMPQIIAALPEMRLMLQPAYRLAKTEHSGIKRYTSFILILIILSLNPEVIEQ